MRSQAIYLTCRILATHHTYHSLTQQINAKNDGLASSTAVKIRKKPPSFTVQLALQLLLDRIWKYLAGDLALCVHCARGAPRAASAEERSSSGICDRVLGISSQAHLCTAGAAATVTSCCKWDGQGALKSPWAALCYVNTWFPMLLSCNNDIENRSRSR